METHIAALPHHARGRALDYPVWPGWRVLMEDAGLRTAPVLRRAGLPGDLFARSQVRLDPQQFFQLWQAPETEALSLDSDLPAPLRIARVFEPGLRQRLSDLDCTAGMAERVRSLLIELLSAGAVSMGEVSRQLVVSTRTLQRKLHEEGTTFQRTLDAVRDALAHHYLGSTAMSAAEISFLLGFEDANSFARAFQGRTGHTPQTVRNRLREAAATSAASMRSK